MTRSGEYDGDKVVAKLLGHKRKTVPKSKHETSKSSSSSIIAKSRPKQERIRQDDREPGRRTYSEFQPIPKPAAKAPSTENAPRKSPEPIRYRPRGWPISGPFAGLYWGLPEAPDVLVNKTNLPGNLEKQMPEIKPGKTQPQTSTKLSHKNVGKVVANKKRSVDELEEAEAQPREIKKLKAVHRGPSPVRPTAKAVQSNQLKRQRNEEEVQAPRAKRTKFVGTRNGCAPSEEYLKPLPRQRKVGLPPRGLYNHKFSCFINATLQAFHTVEEFAKMDSEKNLMGLETGGLGTDLQAFKRGRSRAAAANILAASFEKRAKLPSFTINDHFVHTMRQMSSPDDDEDLNPLLFEEVSGAMFSGAEGPMNGDHQEDVHDFIKQLVPALSAGELFDAVVEGKGKCRKCGKEESVTKTLQDLPLPVPDNMAKGGKIDFEVLVNKAMESGSLLDFETLRCGGCKELGQWDAVRGSETRLSLAPKYLMTHTSRCGYETVQTNRKTKEGKPVVDAKMYRIPTRVHLPAGTIKLQDTDGGKVSYELLATIEHRGKDFIKGHFVTTRSVGGKWYTCDDKAPSNQKVLQVRRQDVQRCHQSTINIFKKVVACTPK